MMQPATTPKPQSTWKKNAAYILAFAVGAIVLTLLPFLQQAFLQAPPPLASLGEWRLVDEHGRPFGSAELRGKVWIASFFFTHCPSACPAIQAEMKRALAHVDDLGDRIELVSFTVDPDTDTPDVLRAYGEKLGASFDHWHFVTGSEAALKDLLEQRFRTAMGDRAPLDGASSSAGSLYEIAHAQKLALVDQNGDVRGFWSIEGPGPGNLINAARMLAQRGPNP